MQALIAGGKKKPYSDGEEAIRQVLDGTGSLGLNCACRRLSCIGRLPGDLRQQQHLAALCANKQSSLKAALLALHGDKPRKGGLKKKARLTPA